MRRYNFHDNFVEFEASFSIFSKYVGAHRPILTCFTFLFHTCGRYSMYYPTLDTEHVFCIGQICDIWDKKEVGAQSKVVERTDSEATKRIAHERLQRHVDAIVKFSQ